MDIQTRDLIIRESVEVCRTDEEIAEFAFDANSRCLVTVDDGGSVKSHVLDDGGKKASWAETLPLSHSNV